MAKGNGKPAPVVNVGHDGGTMELPRGMSVEQWQQYNQRCESLITNALTFRQEFFRRFSDPRRDIYQECGYPEHGALSVRHYQEMYDREPIARRVVNCLPRESWQVQPSLYEDESADVLTPFEKRWQEIGEMLSGERSYYKDNKGGAIWEKLRRADELCGIGRYGVILLGIDDGKDLSLPVDEMADVMEQDGPLISPPGGAVPNPRPQLNFVDPTKDTSAASMYYRSGLEPTAEDVMKAADDIREGQRNSPDTAPETTKLRNLIYIHVFPESLAEITSRESRSWHPRYGKPTKYRITLEDPREQTTGVGAQMNTFDVHWSRVVHIVDNPQSSDIYGTPRQQPVFNPLADIVKVRGGSAEMYWKGAFPGISFESHPTLGPDVFRGMSPEKKQETLDMMENYMNGLQRFIATVGMSAKSLAPQVVDPTPQIQVQIDAICIALEIPKRVFMGSERGELASSQDDASWNDRIRLRQNNHNTARVVVPLIDRLINLRVMPPPGEDGYFIYWPDLDSQTDEQKARIGQIRTQALAAYVSSGLATYMTFLDYLIHILKMEEEVAESIVANGEEMQEEEERRQQEQMEEMMQQGFNPHTGDELNPEEPPADDNEGGNTYARASSRGDNGGNNRRGGGNT